MLARVYRLYIVAQATSAASHCAQRRHKSLFKLIKPFSSLITTQIPTTVEPFTDDPGPPASEEDEEDDELTVILLSTALGALTLLGILSF